MKCGAATCEWGPAARPGRLARWRAVDSFGRVRPSVVRQGRAEPGLALVLKVAEAWRRHVFDSGRARRWLSYGEAALRGW